MNRLVMMLVACALVTVSHRSWADEPHTNEVLRVILELSDGSRVIGVPGIEAVPVQTAYTKMNVPLKQIVIIRMGGDRETAEIEMRNGDKLKGVITVAPLPLTTIFGKVTLGVANIRQLAVLSGGSDEGTKTGLIAWYKFDDGTAKDASEFANHGILHNVKPAPDRFRRANGAMTFDGRSSWIEAPSSRVYDALDAITIALWLCPAEVPAGASRSYSLVGKQPSGDLSLQHSPTTSNHGGLFDLDLNANNGAWDLYVASQVAPYMCTEGHTFPLKSLSAGQWQHLAVTASRAENRVRVYCNGSQVGDLVYTEQASVGKILTQPNSEPLRIGKRKDADFSSDGTLWFSGSMDDVRIYDRVLSEDEIRGISGP